MDGASTKMHRGPLSGSDPVALVCPVVSGAVDDADDLHALGYSAIQDKIVADRQIAKLGAMSGRQRPPAASPTP